MKVPSAKIEKIHGHLDAGSKIVLRPEVVQDVSESNLKDPDFYPTKL
jgi:hypothetical protein